MCICPPPKGGGPRYICSCQIVIMPDKPINEIESFQIIQEMIQKARNHFTENGHLYLIWGWVILFCSIAHFILDHFYHFPGFDRVWLLTWVVLIYQFYYIYKKRKQERARTYTDKLVGYVWMAFGLALFLCAFAVVYVSRESGVKVFGVLYPVFLALYGIPTFLSGVILKVPPLQRGGLYCWALSLISIFLPSDFQILLLGAAAIVAWIIPGFWLQRYHKSLNA